MNRDTMIMYAGYRSAKDAGPFRDGPQFASTYVLPGDPKDQALTYGRFHNPTRASWGDAHGVLEGGHAIALASGIAAVSASASSPAISLSCRPTPTTRRGYWPRTGSPRSESRRDWPRRATTLRLARSKVLVFS